MFFGTKPDCIDDSAPWVSNISPRMGSRLFYRLQGTDWGIITDREPEPVMPLG